MFRGGAAGQTNSLRGATQPVRRPHDLVASWRISSIFKCIEIWRPDGGGLRRSEWAVARITRGA